MLNIFPYIFSTTFNTIANNMAPVEVQFKEHKRGYTIQCYLPGTKKENINLEYDNNYITLQVKRNMFYSNNQNIAVAVVQAGGDINEDYYVENADPSGIRAVFKNDTLNVLIPKSTYISKDTTIVDVDTFKE